MNQVPYEVLAKPLTVYYGEPGAVFPAVDEVPDPGDWLKVGTYGYLNYDSSEGVNISHEDSINFWRSLGDTGSRKAFRDTEDTKIGLLLADMTLESYTLALNRNTITTVAPGVGTVGYKWMGTQRGFDVDTVALLLRGENGNAYSADLPFQWEFWRAAQTGKPQPKSQKANPFMLALEWTLLVDPTKPTQQSTGRIVMAHAPAST